METPTADEQISNALERLQPSHTLGVVGGPNNEDENESDKVSKFLTEVCTCGRGCNMFSKAEIESSRLDCQGLAKDELDMAILGELMAGMNTSDDCGPSHKHRKSIRQRSRVTYMYKGREVCSQAFRFFHDIGNAVCMCFSVRVCTCVCKCECEKMLCVYVYTTKMYIYVSPLYM